MSWAGQLACFIVFGLCTCTGASVLLLDSSGLSGSSGPSSVRTMATCSGSRKWLGEQTACSTGSVDVRSDVVVPVHAHFQGCTAQLP
eukprot:363901-Chlamydomonas_euryale.AAC.25